VATDHTTLEERMVIASGAGADWKLPSGRPGEIWVVTFDAEGKNQIVQPTGVGGGRNILLNHPIFRIFEIVELPSLCR